MAGRTSRNTGGSQAAQYYASRYGSGSGSSKYYGSAPTNTYYSNRTSKTSSTPIADPREQNAAMLNANVTDSYLYPKVDGSSGPSALDMALAGLTFGRTSGGGGFGGGGGRGGGGGGGGAAGPDPAVVEAMKAMLAERGVNPYPGYKDRLQGLHSDDRVNQMYDRYAGDVGAAATTGRDRVSGIARQLADRTDVAARNIASGFADREAAIGQLMAEAQQAQGRDVAGMNNMLSRFGAGSVQGESAPLANLAAASKMSVGDAANMFAQSMTDRAAIGQSLADDVSLGISRDEAGLMSRIAAQRAAGLQSNADNRAKLDADLYLRAADWDNAEQQRLANLRLQAAQLGITL